MLDGEAVEFGTRVAQIKCQFVIKCFVFVMVHVLEFQDLQMTDLLAV